MLLAYIVAPAAIAVIAALLAALISVTDKIVNNYGEVKVTINGEKELTVKGGSPLLHTLSAEGIFIPSACGGRGSCGACKCQVTSDVGPILPTEAPYLDDQEIKDNVRLSCQVKVKEDIAIKIPDELFNVKQYKGTVESIKDVTHDIKEVYVRLDDPKDVNFKAGQYAQFVIPPYDKIKESTQRAYSISSVPSDKGHLEFLIRLVPGGIATTYVHEHLKEGQKVDMVGPFGDFYMQDTDATMVCVAGGSGMAPFKSILADMLEKAMTEREVWYFFGARTVRDIYYLEEMKEIEKKWPNFHFVGALSEPEEGDGWEGETGLITDVLDKFMKTKMSDRPREGYLCGSPGMINACNKVMLANGMSLEKIYYDSFA